jgi:hypothetical protein
LLMIISNNYLRWFNRRVRYGKTEGLAEERRRNGIIRAVPLFHS